MFRVNTPIVSSHINLLYSVSYKNNLVQLPIFIRLHHFLNQFSLLVSNNIFAVYILAEDKLGSCLNNKVTPYYINLAHISHNH